MAGFRLSPRAEADLLALGAYTLRNWGARQTARYTDDLEAYCQMLAANSALGRACGWHPAWRAAHGVLPERHVLGDEGDGP